MPISDDEALDFLEQFEPKTRYPQLDDNAALEYLNSVAPPKEAPIDLNRPIVPDAKTGQPQTERSTSFNVDGKEVLIPTIVNGKQYTPDEAFRLYKEGKNKAIGVYDSPEEATAASKARSQRISKVRGLDKSTATPPSLSDVGQGLLEIPKGFASRVGTVVPSVAMQGASALDPREIKNRDVTRFRDRLKTVPAMSQEEVDAFRSDLETENPITRRIIRGQIDDLIRGETKPEDLDKITFTPTAQRELYKGGAELAETNRFPAAPGFEQSPGRLFGEALASVAEGFIAFVVGGPTVAGAAFTLGGAGEAADRAVKGGATQAEIDRATILGTGPGATDILPIEVALRSFRIPAPLRRTVAREIARIGGRIFVQGAVEAGQEGFQRYLQNLIARETHTREQDLAQDVFPEAKVGAEVGATTQVIGETIKFALKGFAGRRGGRFSTGQEGEVEGPTPLEPIDIPREERVETSAEPAAPAAPTASVTQDNRGPEPVAPPRKPPPIYEPFVSYAIEDVAQERATPEQWRAMLRPGKAEGVTQDMLDWMGLEQWLSEQKGSVSKKDIQAYVAAHEVELEDRLLGGESRGAELVSEVQEENATVITYKDAQGETIEYVITPHEGRFIVDIKDPAEDNIYRLIGATNSLEAARHIVHGDVQDVGNTPNTRFSDYKLPGGKDGTYKELLIRMPELEGEDKKLPDYTSPHFRDQEIAFIQFDEREGPSGERVLMINTVQSDLHQRGRKQGYTKINTKSRVDEINKEITSIDSEIGSIRDINRTSTPNDASRLRELKEEMSVLEKERQRLLNALPNAPFKGDHWIHLALKRMLKYAAENGFDVVSWGTGGQIAAFTGEQEGKLRIIYDSKIPRYLNRYTKKWGGKVEKVVLPDFATGTSRPQTRYDIDSAVALQNLLIEASDIAEGADAEAILNLITRSDTASAQERPGILNTGVGALPVGAKAAVNEANRRATVANPGDANQILRITPAMREALLAGRDEKNLAKVPRREPKAPNVDTAAETIVGESLQAVSMPSSVPDSLARNLDPDPFIGAAANENAALAEPGTFTPFQLIGKPGGIVFFDQDGRLLGPFKDGREAGKEVAKRRGGSVVEFQRPATSRTTSSSEKRNTLENTALALSALEDQVESAFARMVADGRIDAETADGIQGDIHSLANRGMPELTDAEMQRLSEDFRVLMAEMQSGARETSGTTIDPAPENETPKKVLNEFGPPSGREPPGDVGGPDSSGITDEMDRISKRSRLFLGLLQVSARNPHLRKLQEYVGLNRRMATLRMKWVNRADNTLKDWSQLKTEDADNLSRFAFDMTEMEYLSNAEKRSEVVRQPTEEERNRLVLKHGLTSEAIEIYKRLEADFGAALDELQRVSIDNIRSTIQDTAAAQQAIAKVRAETAQLKKRPYFPMIRFGEFTLTVRDSNKKVVSFETFATERERNRAYNNIYRIEKAKGNAPQKSKIPEIAQPFMGLPSFILQRIRDNLPHLSDNTEEARIQRDWIEQFQFDVAPEQSYRKRQLHRRGIPGFSFDTQRAYAHYFLHFANHIARVEFSKPMQDTITEMRNDARLNLIASDNRIEMSNFMQDHLNSLLNPQGDWAQIRAFAFFWHLGYNISSAFINATQIVMVTAPYLAARFGSIGKGDAIAVAALVRAYKNIKQMYTADASKQKLEPHFMEALNEAIIQGTVDQSQATELAGTAQGPYLKHIATGGATTRALKSINYYGAIPFSAVEKMNRRVAFYAAYDLMMRNPDVLALKKTRRLFKNKNLTYRQEVLSRDPTETFELQRKYGWNDLQTAAFLAGREAVDTTQYEYSEWARPKFMRGKKGTLFTFFMFQQNSLFVMGNMPGAGRYWLILLAMAGVGGLPFAKDINSVITAIASLFDKDFNPEREARKFINDMVKGSIFDRVGADYILHGISSDMGLKHVAEYAFGVPFPGIDVSNRVGFGQIIPGVKEGADAIAQGKPFTDILGRTTQDVAGAAFGIPLNFARAAFDKNLPYNDFKRYKLLMPTALRNLTTAAEFAFRGEERTSKGDTFLKFDPRKPDQMMELVALGLGLQPSRRTQKWDATIQVSEGQNFWKGQRMIMLRNLYEAVQTQDKGAIQSVGRSIREYNKRVPYPEMGISNKEALASIKARTRRSNLREQGLPAEKRYNRFTRDLQSQFPQAEIIVDKPVK